MGQNNYITIEDYSILKEYLNGTKKMVQDTLYHSRRSKISNNIRLKRTIYEEEAHVHYFLSHNESYNFMKDEPISYIRNNVSVKFLNNLKIGKYTPEIFLDLHGLTQYEARRALGRLMVICQKESFFCAGIIHGHGKHILKSQTPLWLAKHPDIIAFYRASQVFGNSAGITCLIDIKK
ncbi:endonuclease SmrB [Buchnera aphidicola]|uniref:endonuclease SmrB n=1 Tax=Buchnera aphidicola TaxID=9 RepID=UPI0031B80405